MPAFRWWTEIPISAVRLLRPLGLGLGFRLAVALLLLVCLPARSGLAMSEDACIKDDKCKDHYSKAIKLYKDESYDEALGEFQTAYEARSMPLLLVNIGRTMQKLGRPKDALSYYERFLQAESKIDAETRKKVEDYIVQVKALIGPEAKQPTVDAGPLPAAKPLPPPPPPPPPPGRNLVIIGAVLAGVGVVGIGVSIGLGAVSNQQYSTFQNPATVDEFDKRAAMASAQSFFNGAIVAGILGAAVTATGGALIGIGARTMAQYKKAQGQKSPPPAPPQAVLLPTVGGGALVLQGGF